MARAPVLTAYSRSARHSVLYQLGTQKVTPCPLLKVSCQDCLSREKIPTLRNPPILLCDYGIDSGVIKPMIPTSSS